MKYRIRARSLVVTEYEFEFEGDLPFEIEDEVADGEDHIDDIVTDEAKDWIEARIGESSAREVLAEVDRENYQIVYIEAIPPTPESVGYHSHDAARVAVNKIEEDRFLDDSEV